MNSWKRLWLWSGKLIAEATALDVLGRVFEGLCEWLVLGRSAVCAGDRNVGYISWPGVWQTSRNVLLLTSWECRWWVRWKQWVRVVTISIQTINRVIPIIWGSESWIPIVKTQNSRVFLYQWSFRVMSRIGSRARDMKHIFKKCSNFHSCVMNLFLPVAPPLLNEKKKINDVSQWNWRAPYVVKFDEESVAIVIKWDRIWSKSSQSHRYQQIASAAPTET